MSKEREVENSVATVTKEDIKQAPDLARIAQVLERGIIADRLDVKLPDNLCGEWVRDDPIEIARMQALGYNIETNHGKDRGLHSVGDRIKIGDVILMTAPKEVGELVGQYKQGKFNEVYRPQVTTKEASEKTTFEKSTGGDVKITATVDAKQVNAEQILNTLKAEEQS